MMTAPDDLHQTRTADPLYRCATRVVLESGRPSISLLTRTFSIGYSQAAKLVGAMEGDVIAEGEIERYTTYLRNGSGNEFELKRLP